MLPAATPNPYKRHRFPSEIISHAVWLYYRFSLSHRDVEELLFERGIIKSLYYGPSVSTEYSAMNCPCSMPMLYAHALYGRIQPGYLVTALRKDKVERRS